MSVSNVALTSDQERQAETLILVVDDHPHNRDMITRRLGRQGFRTEIACNGEEALAKLRTQRLDLVMLDIMTPIMDGYVALKAMKEDPFLKNVPVIMITALNEVDSIAKCLELGADDYIIKPFNHIILAARVNASLAKKHLNDHQLMLQNQLEGEREFLEHHVFEQVQEIASTQLAAIFAMSKLAESKDPETGKHLERMREYCKLLSEQMGKLQRYQNTIDQNFISNIYNASPLHDIGKVGIPDNVLLKPGELTYKEWTVMKTHTTIGSNTLRAVDQQYPGSSLIRTGIDIAEFHHEKWNGSGYPHGLKGERIPLVARILALGDVYDALTSKRCYKQKFSHETSRQILIEGSGKHFDPDVVDAFLEVEDEFIRVRKDYNDKE